MASGDPCIIELHNHNKNALLDGQGDDDAVIFMIDQQDDTKNTITLVIKNASGGELDFSASTPIYVYMDQLLPLSAIERVTFTCPDGWVWSVDPADLVHERIILAPSSTSKLEDSATLTFQIKSVYFLDSELKTLASGMRDFVIACTYWDATPASRKVCLRPWVDQPNLVPNFQALLVEVPQTADKAWNVKVNDYEIWVEDKRDEVVFSNSMAGQRILTRLAFSLVNQDKGENNPPLNLTPESVFKVSFLPGKGFAELGDGVDLLSNLTIKEITTSAWTISSPSLGSALEWTLVPTNKLSMAPRDSYTFLIDAVIANGNPPAGADVQPLTGMYVFYTNVPLPGGEGSYDDSFLKIDITKKAPGPGEVESFTVDPVKSRYDPGDQITLKWTVFGVDTLTLSYTDAFGVEQNQPVGLIDQRAVTLPVSDQDKTVTFKLMSGEATIGSPYAARVQNLNDFLTGKTLQRSGGETVLNYNDRHANGVVSLSPATIQLNPNGVAIVSSTLDWNHDPKWSHVYTVTGTWTPTIQPGSVTLSITTPYAENGDTWDVGEYALFPVGTDDFCALGANSSTGLQLSSGWTDFAGGLEGTFLNQICINRFDAVSFSPILATWNIVAAKGAGG